jgi:hypothetical protein
MRLTTNELHVNTAQLLSDYRTSNVYGIESRSYTF